MQPMAQRTSPKIQVEAVTCGTESVRADCGRAGGFKFLSADCHLGVNQPAPQ